MLQANPKLTHFLQAMEKSAFASLEPIAELQTPNRDKLLAKARGFVLEHNSRLSGLDAQKWFLYLLDGMVERRGTAVGREMVRPKSAQSLRPLFRNGSDRGAEIVALSRVELVGFDRSLFEVLRAQDSQAGTEVGHIEASAAEGILFQRLFADYSAGKLDIPCRPEVVRCVRALSSGDQPDADDVARLILADPGLAARVVRTARAAHGDVDDVPQALGVIGLEGVSAVCAGIADASVCRDPSEVIDQRLLATHEHSVQVAIFSAVLAERIPGFSPQRLALAGLLHDVGMFPVLRAAWHHVDTITSEQELDSTTDKLHGVIGGLVLQQWGFGGWLAQVCDQADNWTRDNPGPVDEADIILVAQLHSFIGTDRIKTVPPFATLPAYRKFVADGAGTEFSISVFKQGRARLADLQRLFRKYPPA